MKTREDLRQSAFDRRHFDAQLRLIIPPYRVRLQHLFTALSTFDMLFDFPALLHTTGPIVISGFAGEQRGDPETRLNDVTLSIPFTDSQKLRSIEFGVKRLNANWDTLLSVILRRNGGNDVEDVLDLWDFSELNGLGETWQDAIIPGDADLPAAIGSILVRIERLLREHCSTYLEGGSWPYCLRQCVETGNADQFQQQTEQLGHLHLVDCRGMTLLSHAVVCGRPDLVAVLLKMGARPNFVSAPGRTPGDFPTRGYAALHFLAAERELSFEPAREILQLLLDHDADVNQITATQFTPLGLAARYLKTDLVRNLLKSGARKLGQGWDWWATGPGEPPIHARIVDQLLKSALGHASRIQT